MKRILLILIALCVSFQTFSQIEKSNKLVELSVSYHYGIDFQGNGVSALIDYNFLNKPSYDMFAGLTASSGFEEEYIGALYGFRYKFSHEMFSNDIYPFVQVEAGPIVGLGKYIDDFYYEACIHVGCYKEFNNDRLLFSLGTSICLGTVSATITYSFGSKK